MHLVKAAQDSLQLQRLPTIPQSQIRRHILPLESSAHLRLARLRIPKFIDTWL